MDEAECRKRINDLCLLFTGIPNVTSSQNVCKELHAEDALNIPSATGLSDDNKWIVLFKSLNDVKKYQEANIIQVTVNDESYPVTAETPTPCDIPEEWLNLKNIDSYQQNRYQHADTGQYSGQMYDNPYSVLREQLHSSPSDERTDQSFGNEHSHSKTEDSFFSEFSQLEIGQPVDSQDSWTKVDRLVSNQHLMYPSNQPHTAQPASRENQSEIDHLEPNQHIGHPVSHSFDQPHATQPATKEDSTDGDQSVPCHPGHPVYSYSQPHIAQPTPGENPPLYFPSPYLPFHYGNIIPGFLQYPGHPPGGATVGAGQTTSTPDNICCVGGGEPHLPADNSRPSWLLSDNLKSQTQMPSGTAVAYPEHKMDKDVEAMEMKQKKDTEKKQTTTLKVSELPMGATEDSLVVYFESRKVGGESVEHIELDMENFTAHITFEDPAAVDRILQKLPLLFMNTKIEIEPVYSDTGSISDSENDSGDELRETTPSENKIVVHGVKPGTSDDTVLLYFENTRRSGGGDILKFRREDEVIYITFEDDSVIDRVLSKERKIDEAPLQVKRFVMTPPPPPLPPRPTYNDKFFVSGINPETTKDCLLLFLEAKAKSCPKEIIYGEKEGTALIIFEENPDFDKLKTAISSRPLDNYRLSVSTVPITNVVMVTGIKDTTSKDTIHLYFESRKRSGGGDVEDVKLNSQDGTCLVSFEDPEVVHEVCKRSHRVEGHDLHVSIYYECLGSVSLNSQEDVGSPRFKIPESITIHDEVNGKKIQFLRSMAKVRQELEKSISSCHACIDWSKEKLPVLVINCILTTEVKDCRNLAKTWQKTVTDIVNRFLAALTVSQHAVHQEAWKLVMEGLNSLNVSHPDGIAVTVENEREINVVGYRHIVDNVSKQVSAIIDKVTEELDRQKKITTDKFPLEHHKINLLEKVYFADKTKSRFPNLKIDVRSEDCLVEFEGLMGDITAAKLSIYELLQKVKSSNVGKFSEGRLSFLNSEIISNYLYQKFEDQNVVGVWEVSHDGHVTMYSLSDPDTVKANHILKESVLETPVSFRPESLELIQSKEWTNKKTEIEGKYAGLVKMVPCLGKQQIIIFSTSDVVGDVREEVDDFILNNTVLEEMWNLRSGQLRYVQVHHKKEIEKLSDDLKDQKCQIKVIGSGIQIRGTIQSLPLAKKEVTKIFKQIEEKKHEFKKPGIVKYIKSDQGVEKIKRVEKMQKCVIEINEKDEDENFGDDGRQTKFTSGDSTPVEVACSSLHGGKRIFIVKGDITELQNVDVIVNPANKELRHAGGLAKVIVSKGGSAIQQECLAYVKQKGRLFEGDIFCGQPGNLKCKAILHAVGPVYQNGINRENDLLREVVLKALEEADNRYFESIGVPAISSGVFGFPVALATKLIVEAVKYYFEKNKDSGVKDVYLCDILVGNVKFFLQALKSVFGAKNVIDRHQPSYSDSTDTPKYRGTGGSSRPSGHISKSPSQPLCNVNIKVIEGQLSHQNVDVIVNTTARSLKLNHGAVSSSLLHKGGHQLQQECSQNYPDGVQYGDVAITTGGQLRCQSVFHGSLVEYTYAGPPDPLQTFKNFVEKCLREADRCSYNTIAFPAIGTGNLGFPRDIVAKEMFSCVTDFSINNPKSSLAEVRFVVYDQDRASVKAFRDEERRWKSGGSRGGRKFSSDPHASAPANRGGSDVRGGHASSHHDSDQSCLKIGSILLNVYQGDITQAQTEVIVNATNGDFDLTRGAVCVAIAKAGGKDLVRQVSLQKDSLRKKGIAVTATTGGSKMSYHYIIHLNSEIVEEKKWKKHILKILLKCEEIQASSIAFPALGTGMGHKIEDLAQGFCEALIEVQNSDLEYLKEVHMVIFQPAMVTSFLTQVDTVLAKEATKGPGFLEKHFGIWKDEKSAHKKLIASSAITLPPEVSSVMLTIYSNSKSAIDDAIEAIDQQCETDFRTEVISDEDIKEFNPVQVKELSNLENEFGVDIKLEQRIGRIRIHGPIQNVLDVSTPIHKLIHAALKRKQEQHQAAYVSEFVQWSFIEISHKGKKLEAYPKNINLLLENAYRSQKSDDTVSFCDADGNKYIVDLNAYVEYPANDPSDRVDVIRRDLIKDTIGEIPAEWTTMKGNENLTVISLSPSDKEYKMVVKKFTQRLQSQYTVVKVERIQNKMLYHQYLAKKKLMESQNAPGHNNEQTLWHGTPAAAVDSINTYGFNRSYCGRNAVVYGNGVYFAVGAEYSARDQYATQDHNGQKRIYMCKVLTGEFTQGSQNIRVPPPKGQQAFSSAKALMRASMGYQTVPTQGHITYDSVVDNMRNPGIFVIFNDTQAYPEYLVTFQ